MDCNFLFHVLEIQAVIKQAEITKVYFYSNNV